MSVLLASVGFLIVSIAAPAASASRVRDQRLAASSQVFWVLEDGRLVASGDAAPMRGDPEERVRNHFEAIEGLPEVQAVAISLEGDGAAALGQRFALALDERGDVWGWGNNDSGQLGLPADDLAVRRPARIRGLSSIVAIAAGYDFTLALRDDGRVLALGGNVCGALGDQRRARRRSEL